MSVTDCGRLRSFLLSKADSNHHKQNQNLLCYHYTIGQSCLLADAKVVVFCATTKFLPLIFILR